MMIVFQLIRVDNGKAQIKSSILFKIRLFLEYSINLKQKLDEEETLFYQSTFTLLFCFA